MDVLINRTPRAVLQQSTADYQTLIDHPGWAFSPDGLKAKRDAARRALSLHEEMQTALRALVEAAEPINDYRGDDDLDEAIGVARTVLAAVEGRQ